MDIKTLWTSDIPLFFLCVKILHASNASMHQRDPLENVPVK